MQTGCLSTTSKTGCSVAKICSARVQQYIKEWTLKDYSSGIPDEVPAVLQRQLLAPSWKAIADALLRNDLQLLSLGFTGVESPWYGELKRVELEARDTQSPRQGRLF